MKDDSLIIQGTPEWFEARAGSLGSSQLSAAIARAQSGTGRGTTSKNLMIDLALERITGKPLETFQSQAMLVGKEREPRARELYSLVRDVEVREVGLVRHPRLKGTHSSPDGLIGEDGCVEFKCPNRRTHFETILSRKSIDRRYILQVQWHMACTGRMWCDFVSYNPDFPPNAVFFVKRIDRDDAFIEALEEEVRDFLFEVESRVRELDRFLKE